MKIYLAGPCDSENRTTMVNIAKYLRHLDNTVYCPFELKIENAWDYPQEEWARKVFDADMEAINNSDVLIIISVGRISSAGTNWEQGYAYGRGIPTYVIQITNEPTSLMTYCGSTGFYNGFMCPIENVLDFICDMAQRKTGYHYKCKTVLT